ncbi:pyridoxamine 5'-phosphate oxidase [Acinetobacter rathckeae]|uniref:pyridoxamine 5'-phosphate oxidase n=1 Tax=Acinetobacter rathckeae TaxID=2605272 RepID=UPI0018A2F020|nr:pyridoxamine 5'-phosphate oxidase [Acinetobacter rathckeae]MBF7688966.1 pyridoxamine 5'-phosphate oxidase [Acinetobacter rathckeae]MBF7696365.1 pyridoxamine 5'-phosphate oxidase [Acinetobacter rathckeae]
MSDPIKDLSELRLSYEKGELLESQVAKNPHEQFLQWFNHALTVNTDEPYAMYLATVDGEGQPHVRTVLLRGATEQGYTFYTNYDSQKGQDLAQNTRAEILFYWPSLERQVRISGQVVKVSEQESVDYYHKRPRDSQIAAHVSTPQSGVIDSRATLQQHFDDFFASVATKTELDKPKFWGGYRLQATAYEFWQGRPNRLHDRLQYTKQDDATWQLQRLMP